MKKKILALILAGMMLLSGLPGVMAEDTSTVGETNSDADYLELSKKAEKTGDNEYTLTLEAYATQQVTGTPTDVVLVLDQSGSMLHAANVDMSNLKHYVSNNASYDGLDLYIQDAMTWEEVQEELKDPKVREGAKHPGYYMVMSELYSNSDLFNESHASWETYKNEAKLYALEYRDDGKWYRYSTMGCGNLTTGAVNQHIEADEVGELVRGGNVDYYFPNCIFYKTVLGVTIDAMYSFMEIIEGTESLRVAMVGFGGPRRDVSDPDPDDFYTGTGFYDGEEFTTIGKDFDYETTIKNGDFFKLTNDTDEMNDLWASWGEYGAKRNNTATDLGFRMAQELFDHDYTSSKANRIIVLFSDGVPSSPMTNPDTVVANLKNGKSWDGSTDLTYVPEIYTIGPVSHHTNVTKLEGWATSQEHCFQPSINELEQAFEKIAGEIVRKTANLGDQTVLLDGIAPSFTLPSSITSVLEDESKTDAEKKAAIKEKIKVYTADATADKDGNISFETEVAFNDAEIEVEKGADGLWKVGVSNFDYTTNAVTGTGIYDQNTGEYFYGKKLIVEIKIVVNPDFLGGDDVLTNTTDSGIYGSNGDFVKGFEPQKVDIPLKNITPAFKDGNIYVSQQAELPHIANVGEFSVGEGKYTLNGVNNAYVDIVYEIKASDGTMTLEIPAGTKFEDIDKLTWTVPEGLNRNPVLTEDTGYTVKCKVESPKVGTQLKATEATGNPTIHVYKPVITFKDSAINLGEKAPDFKATNLVEVKWTHATLGDAPDSMGAAPELTYKYYTDGKEITSTAFTKDTPVKVTVETVENKGNHATTAMDVTTHATFIRQACNFENCDHKTESKFTVDKEQTDWTNFVVHIKSFDLVIVKEGNEIGKDHNDKETQSFIFRVEYKAPNATEYAYLMDVVINGADSTTIKTLPVGNYKVTELENWSWRYDATDATQDVDTATTQNENGVITVTFNNDRTNGLWLSGDCYAHNLWN